MADLCVCGHEEREHAYDPTESRPVCFGNAMACPCARYRRSPLSAFRGPSASFTREEAAGWLRGMGFSVVAHFTAPPTGADGLSTAALRRDAREFVKRARLCVDHGQHEAAVEMYLAARILRAVRP